MCSCNVGYIGAPPTCRPECVLNSECPLDKACVRNQCTDPCPGTCGYRALCRVVGHNPICSCPNGFVGDPFNQCVKQRKISPTDYCTYLARMFRFYRTSRSTTKRPLHTIPVWFIRNLPNFRRTTCLFLLTKLLQATSQL